MTQHEAIDFLNLTSIYDLHTLDEIAEGMKSNARYAPTKEQQIAMRQVASAINEFLGIRARATRHLVHDETPQ
jgi:hypothetical protein